MFSKASLVMESGIEDRGNLYISGVQVPKNQKLLDQLKIKAIVSAIRQSNYDKLQIPSGRKILNIQVDDQQEQELLPYFEQTNEFIQKNLKITNVLVHCIAGVSRSATICIAYIMKKQKWGYTKTYQQVKKRRSYVNPNSGFVKQLKQYQRMLFQ